MAIFIGFAIYWGYFAIFEILWKGQTPGKRFAGIRVIKESGRPINAFEAIGRNLMRAVDVYAGNLRRGPGLHDVQPAEPPAGGFRGGNGGGAREADARKCGRRGIRRRRRVRDFVAEWAEVGVRMNSC